MSIGAAIINGIKDGATTVLDFAGDIAEAILGAFKKGWNAVADKINDFIPNEVGFDTPFGFVGVNLPDNPIPKFHTGGVVPGRPGDEMLAILQAGEQVIPASAMGTASSSSSSGAAIVVHVHGTVVTDRELDQVVASALARHERHNRTKARR